MRNRYSLGETMKFLLAITSILTPFFSMAAEAPPKKSSSSSIRVVPVSPTPEPDRVELALVFPKQAQTISHPIDLQFQLSGYPLGTMSNFTRKSEIYNDEQGQSIRVIIDNLPHLSIYNSFVDSLNENNIYYEQTLNKTIPFGLKEGIHIIRAFPVRSYGESLKNSRSFRTGVFYTGNTQQSIDLTAPFLTYNMPQGQIPYKSDQPLLLDFYISNARLSTDGYKIELAIDDQVVRTLTNWVPYYIYGLTRGIHRIRLTLLNQKNEKVPGIFNEVEKKLILY
jgi:hypothetical protein